MNKYGYWSKNILAHLSALTQQLGKFPTSTEMPTSLWAAIKKTKISIYDYQKMLGYSSNEKPYGFWNKIQNLKNEVLKLIDLNNGIFPTLSQIEKSLGSGGKKATLKIGGIYSLAKIMGFEYRKPSIQGAGSYLTSDGHYVSSSYEYLIDEYLYSRNIEHSVDKIIHDEYNYRYDFKINDTFIEIWGFEKGRKHQRCIEYNKKRLKKEALYKKYKLKLISIEQSLFKKPLSQIFEYLDSIFMCKEVRPINLENYFNYCHMWNKDKIKYEISKVIQKLGKFPTSGDLKKNKLGGLLDAINRQGGIIMFSNEMGYPQKPKKRNHWNLQTILSELKTYNEIPNTTELKKQGKWYLVQQIIKYGGFDFFRHLHKQSISSDSPEI
jgi:hypothetical protein